MTYTMTKDEFIKREMNIWGEAHIFELFERGYDILPYNGGFRWVRVLHQTSQVRPLTSANVYATVGKRG